MAASFDASGLLVAAADFAIPIDQVVLEIRRASDNSIAVSRTLNSDQFTGNANELRIPVQLTLKTNPEDFIFTATARSGGVDYYQASGTVTAVAFTTVSTPAITPQYIGPGANADQIVIPQSTALGNGQTGTLVASVSENDVAVTGVPVSFSSSDSGLIIPQQQGLSSAGVTAPATGSGSVTITARIPNGLSATGDVTWEPQATQIVLNGGDGQTIQPGANAQLPLAVMVLDANDAPVANVGVTFAVTAGPTGTAVAPTSVLTDDDGVAQTILTAGNANGAITVTATSPGLTGSPVTFSATVATTIGQPATVTANSATTQNAPVNTAVATPPSVIVRDANGVAVPNVPVTFAIATGGGSLTGGTQNTNSSGIATVGSWTLGSATGANTLTATVTGITPVTFTATGTSGVAATITLVSGDNQTGATAAALVQPLVVVVQDADGNPVPAATVTWAPTDGSAAPASGPTAADGRAQTTWTLGANQLTPTLVASVAGVTPSVTFHATTTFPNPTILLSTTGPNLVGVGLSNTINVTLSQAAGVNGANLSLSSDNTNVLTVSSPTLNIPQGSSTGTFTVTGVSAGTTTIRATAPGYDPAALGFGATLQIISLPATLNVPFGQNQNFPVSLALAAPAGGVTVTIATTDATRVAVVTNTVSIPAGSQVGTATVFGQFPGPATINATATGFVPASTAATTTALLNIVQTSVSLNASFGVTINIELRSGVTTIPAPVGGLVVTLTSSNPNCVAAPATVTIPEGLVNTTAILTYGGVATLPCNGTTVTASAPNITSDVVTANVSVVPPITLNAPGQFTGRLGNGLQDVASGNLSVVTPVATTVRVTSGDPASVLLAPDPTTPGTPFVDIPMAANTNSFTYYTQGVAVSAGAVTITATSPSYSNGTTVVTVVAPAIDLTQLNATTTSLGSTDPFQIRLGVPNAGNTALSALQQLRAGSSPVTATILNSSAAVADLVTTALTGDSVDITIPTGVTSSGGSVALGGVAFDPVSGGTTNVSATIPGFVSVPGATVAVTVNAPNIGLFVPAQGTARVGNGLQDAASGNLQNPNPSPITVRVTSGDPASVLVSPNATTPGTAFLDIAVPANQTSFSYFVQGVGISTGAVTLTATSTGYNNATTTVTAAAAGVDISGLTTTFTSIAATDPFTVRLGVTNAGGTSLSALQTLRADLAPVVATLTSTNPAVGQLITLPDSSSPVTITIPLGSANSFPTVASGGVAFDPLSGGTTAVTVSIPGFTTTNQGTVNITVSAPNITMNTPAQGTARLGVHLMDGASGNLQTAAVDTLVVRVTSGDPAALLISQNDSTVGTPFADITVPRGQSSFVYYTHGVGVSTGTVSITSSTPGYNNGTTSITVVNPALQFSGLPATSTTFSTTDPFSVLIGVPNAGNTSMSAFQRLRPGEATLTSTITNSNGTVAQLVTTAVTGNNVTVAIPVRQQTSPSTVALGGVAFDPLVAGSTVIAATIPGFTALPAATVNMTVSAPTISMSTPGQGTGFVGAGLQDGSSGSFQVQTPGALTVRIQSSNPAVALVSPNATTPGTAFIDVPVVANASSFSYFIQGVPGATGTPQITATAPGYSTGAVNVQIVQAAIQLSSISTTYQVAGANDPITVIVGVPNAGRTSMAAFQNVSAGGTALSITITNGNGTTAALVSQASPGGSNTATITIPINQNQSPSTLAAGGVEFDPRALGTTLVSATGATVFSLPAAAVNVTVQ